MADGRFTRQLATIVSIDAVGFSRLIGQDADAAVAAFEERLALIQGTCHAFGGTSFGAAGDSAMIEFGEPANALLAALEFQDRIAALNQQRAKASRMSFRAGINTGDVIVRDDKRYGDDVNIAARLQEIAPQGGVMISETTWHHVRSVSMARFVAIGEQRFKNILYPVRAYSVRRPEQHAQGEAPAAFTAPHVALPSGPPAIAVLAFQTAPGDGELEAVAEGLSDDIIIGLSNARWLPVIARHSSFRFRGEQVGVIATGLALGARYVVSGTLARVGCEIRVRAVLDDVVAGRTIWAGRFDQPMSGLLAIEDQIGAELADVLAKEVDRVEQRHSYQVAWESLESWQLVRRGRWHMSRLTREDTDVALDLFERALLQDPRSTAALNELSWWFFWRAWVRFGPKHDYRSDMEEVASYARRALEIDALDARPHCHLGVREIMLGRPAKALPHLEQALRLNPSHSFAHSASGTSHLLLGRAAHAIPFLSEAERLNPFGLYGFHNVGEIAAARCFVGDWDGAIEAASRSLALSPSYWYARFIRIGALHRAGRTIEALSELATFRARHPRFDVDNVLLVPFADKAMNALLIGNYLEVATAQKDLVDEI